MTMARVIPIEPTLKLWNSGLVVSGINLFAGIGLAFLPPVVLYGGSLDTGSFYYLFAGIFYPFFNLWQTIQWRNLDRKRQQAVIDESVTGTLVSADHGSNIVDSSHSITVRMQRRLSSCLIIGIIGSLVFANLATRLAGGWQAARYEALQNGQSLTWLWLSVVCNISILIFYIALLIWWLIDQRQELIISQEGLTCRLGHRTSSIPWHEAKLFAVIGIGAFTNATPPQFYELSSERAVIRWSVTPMLRWAGTPAATLGTTDFGLMKAFPSRSEYQSQMQHLPAIVAAYTRLPLHDLR